MLGYGVLPVYSCKGQRCFSSLGFRANLLTDSSEKTYLTQTGFHTSKE